MPLLTTGAGSYVTAAVVSGNLVTNPRALDQSPWVTSFAFVTANAATSYDATTSADFFCEHSGGGTSQYHVLSQSVSKATVSKTYTASFYTKLAPDPRARICLQVDNEVASGVQHVFDIQNGLLLGYGLSTFGTWTAGTPTFPSVGGGWYKATIPNIVTGTENVIRVAFITDGGATTAGPSGFYSGNGTSGVLLDLVELIEV